MIDELEWTQIPAKKALTGLAWYTAPVDGGQLVCVVKGEKSVALQFVPDPKAMAKQGIAAGIHMDALAAAMEEIEEAKAKAEAEAKAKMRAAKKGKRLSQEHRANLSAALRGKPWSAKRWAAQALLTRQN